MPLSRVIAPRATARVMEPCVAVSAIMEAQSLAELPVFTTPANRSKLLFEPYMVV